MSDGPDNCCPKCGGFKRDELVICSFCFAELPDPDELPTEERMRLADIDDLTRTNPFDDPLDEDQVEYVYDCEHGVVRDPEPVEDWFNDDGPSPEDWADMEREEFAIRREQWESIGRALEIGLFHVDGPLPLHSQEWALTRLEQWFYFFKAMLCCAFELRTIPGGADFPDVVPIATLHYALLYAGWECDWAEVGHGVFKNWFVRFVHDSDWNL